MLAIISSISTGLVLTLVRILEPYFFFLIKQEFFQCFGILMTEKEIESS
jgi:hypothetical protein